MERPSPRVRTPSCTTSPRRFTFNTIRFREHRLRRPVIPIVSWRARSTPLGSRDPSAPMDVRNELYYECECSARDGGRLARPSGGGRPPEVGFFPPGPDEPAGRVAAVPLRAERAGADREGESPSDPAEPVRGRPRHRPDHRRDYLCLSRGPARAE